MNNISLTVTVQYNKSDSHDTKISYFKDKQLMDIQERVRCLF
jgi:hypothetical protein